MANITGLGFAYHFQDGTSFEANTTTLVLATTLALAIIGSLSYCCTSFFKSRQKPSPIHVHHDSPPASLFSKICNAALIIYYFAPILKGIPNPLSFFKLIRG